MFNAAPAPAVPIYYHHAHSGNQPAPIYKFVCRERLQRPVSAAEGRAEKERQPHGAVTDADLKILLLYSLFHHLLFQYFLVIYFTFQHLYFNTNNSAYERWFVPYIYLTSFIFP